MCVHCNSHGHVSTVWRHVSCLRQVDVHTRKRQCARRARKDVRLWSIGRRKQQRHQSPCQGGTPDATHRPPATQQLLSPLSPRAPLALYVRSTNSGTASCSLRIVGANDIFNDDNVCSGRCLLFEPARATKFPTRPEGRVMEFLFPIMQCKGSHSHVRPVRLFENLSATCRGHGYHWHANYFSFFFGWKIRWYFYGAINGCDHHLHT